MQADYIKVGRRHRKDLGSIDSLVESIREVGLLQPVVVDAKGNLIAGERRLVACLRLGMRDIPARIVELDPEQALRAEADENQERKNFTPTEARAIRDARLALEKQRAKERQADLNRPVASGNFPQADKGRAKDKAAAGTGYSGRTLDKVAAVEEAAVADPSLDHIVEEMDRTGNVDRAYKQAVKRSAAAAKKRKTMDELAEAEQVRSLLTKARTKHGHLAYWQPVWDAIDKLNGISP